MHRTQDPTNEQLALTARGLRISAFNGNAAARNAAVVLEADLRSRLTNPDFRDVATSAASRSRSPAAAPPPMGHCGVATADSADESNRTIQNLLRTMRTLLDMDIAFVAEFVGDRKVFRHLDVAPGSAPLVAVGDSGLLAQTYCKRVVDGRFPNAIPDIGELAGTADLPSTVALKIAAYISVPVTMRNGDVFGTLCCISHAPRSALGSRQTDALRKVAEIVSVELEKLRS